MIKHIMGAGLAVLFIFALGSGVRSEEEEKTVAKIYLVNIKGGEMPNDAHDAKLRFSNEYTSEEGIVPLKVIFSRGSSFGMRSPQQGNWSNFNYIRINAFNPQPEPVKITFCAKDDTSPYADANAQKFDADIVFPPGRSTTRTIKIHGASNKSGGPFNLEKITHWYITCYPPLGTTLTLYFSDMVLTTEE